MQGFPFGGQTKIAYTQDPNLTALEVTDLELPGRRTTASFFNGSKAEYPRRMHLIQGSDAHSLNTEQADAANKRLGVGARVTEILVKEASFAALKELLTGDDFGRTRPYRGASVWEFVEKARAEGPGLTQAFHERTATKTSRTRPILHDVAAFANTEGGTIYVGATPDTRLPVHGVERPDEDVRAIRAEIAQTIEPRVDAEFEVKQSGNRAVIVIRVPAGDDTPYVYTPTGQIYIRTEAGTDIAQRRTIAELVLRSSSLAGQATGTAPATSRQALRREETGRAPSRSAEPSQRANMPALQRGGEEAPEARKYARHACACSTSAGAKRT